MKKPHFIWTLYLIFAMVFAGCSKENAEVTNGSGVDSGKLKAATKTLTFSGLTWYVKSGTNMGPGPNNWSADNAWVDANGKLHLKITYSTTTKTYQCAEVWTTASLGFGKYEWFIDGRIDALQKDVVLGLFNYPTAAIGPDGTNEIDIEFSKWGNAKNKIGNYTVYPTSLNYSYKTFPFTFTLSGTYTTQRFTWSSTGVRFQSLNGWRTDNLYPIQDYTYAPSSPQNYIPQTAEPVHINLWVFSNGGRQTPALKSSFEIVIGKFQKY
jgi:hypothetical protein